MFRKDNEARTQWSEELVRQCVERQRSILEDIWPALRPGGLLVYSTCTMETAENEGVVQRFLELHPEFVLERAGAFLPVQQTEDAMVQIFPTEDGGDGFFIARMKRL